MSTLEREALEDAYADSPTYVALTERYGDTMPYANAQAFARSHGTSIEALVSEGALVVGTVDTRPDLGHVDILGLLLALGY